MLYGGMIADKAQSMFEESLAISTVLKYEQGKANALALLGANGFQHSSKTLPLPISVWNKPSLVTENLNRPQASRGFSIS
ncbi:MAG: hypothetical protein H6647_09395 [Anaerolineales bacterium]|nr:hypothetical protein [Anaerolineales bacterium]